MNGQSPIGVVVVGTGFGCLTHVRALRAAGFEVDTLVGRDPDKTAARAARFEIAHASTSLAEAMARPGVAAVTIATPPHTHGPLVSEALRAGKHVLCEKPFARDAAEARVLLAAAEQAGVVHMLGTEFRFAPGQALLTRSCAAAISANLVSPPTCCTSRCSPIPTPKCRRGGPTPPKAADGSARTRRT